MQIQGPSHVHGPHSVNGPHHPQLRSAGHADASAGAQSDQFELSAAAEAAIRAADARAAESGEVRHDLVARIRSEIAAGTYETPEKLDGALERLLDQIT